MRKPRNKKENATYHVIARSNRQEFIFEKDNIKDIFIRILKDAKKKYRFKIINFCVMTNHIHLLIKPHPKSDLSKIMQWILSKFAVVFNKIYSYKGHVWYDRFKSIIIESFRQLYAVYEYINNNPVKAGLVKKAEDYKYCGLAYLKNKVFELVDPPDSVY